MIIKVKVMDENEQPKGRAYTYTSNIVGLEVGDAVVADLAGKDKQLMIVETNVDPKEIEGLDYEIKAIKGFASEIEVEPEMKINVEIEEEVLPVIRINFEDLKSTLGDAIEKYKNIVVTEDTLSGCKATQKELAGLRSKIDRYRIDKKKELSKPITDFENQCKELVSMIEKVEQPIKDGIKVFDDKKKDDKEQTATKLIKVVAEETGLREKYASQLTVIDKYRNLTAKENDVKSDLTARAFALLSEQNREDELIDIIKSSIETANERINTKMKFEDFQRFIDRGMPTKDILAEVNARADSIYMAENPPEPEPVAEPVSEPEEELIAESVPEPVPVEKPVSEPESKAFEEVEESIYYAIYRITGSHEELLSVSQFLKDRGISYKVTDQGEV